MAMPGPKATGGRVNMLDVAERAGVSPATVSRSLRGMTNVSAETREKVFEAAHDLQYHAVVEADSPPGSARSVAVIVPFIQRWFFGTVTAAAADRLRDRGYDVILYHLGSVAARDRFFTRMPLARRVAGVLSLSMPLTEDHTLALRALDLPVVTVGSGIPGAPSVGIDEVAAARTAVHHLIHLKHERIGLITGVPDDPRFAFVSSAERRRGAEEALRTAGLALDEDLVAAGAHGVQGGAAAMARLLGGARLPTAVFAEYDELAIGALSSLRRAGLKVPGDMSVVSVDDHEMSAVLDLTTVAQDVAEQGLVAADLMADLLDTGVAASDLSPSMMPTRLVLRGSTAPLPPDGR